MAHLEEEAEEKDNELEAANRDLEKMSNQLYALEEENERLKEAMDRIREDEGVERERLEQLAAALKQVSHTLAWFGITDSLHRKWLL